METQARIDRGGGGGMYECVYMCPKSGQIENDRGSE